MTTHEAFRAQLSSIRAAVAAICELLDDSYVALQVELSRSHKENEALRNKLELIENIVARGVHRGNVVVFGGREERCGDLVSSPQIVSYLQDLDPNKGRVSEVKMFLLQIQ